MVTMHVWGAGVYSGVCVRERERKREKEKERYLCIKKYYS